MNRKIATFIRPFYSSVVIAVPYYDTQVTTLKKSSEVFLHSCFARRLVRTLHKSLNRVGLLFEKQGNSLGKTSLNKIRRFTDSSIVNEK